MSGTPKGRSSPPAARGTFGLQRLAQATGVVLLLGALVLALVQHAPAYAPASVVIGGKTVRVTVARTNEEHMKGLSGRAGLAPDEGMLFAFETDDKYGFWMKDMRFAIDILWLDSERRIVHIAPKVTPETYPRLFEPPVPSRYVLELPAGFVEKHKIRVGDPVSW